MCTISALSHHEPKQMQVGLMYSLVRVWTHLASRAESQVERLRIARDTPSINCHTAAGLAP